MTTINARFRIRGVTTGSGAPADHLNREIAANESNNTFWYGYGVGTGDQAAASHLMFRSDGTRLWHDIIGASDGSTVFVGDGSSLTGVTVGSVAWSAITSKPTTLAGYGITDAVGSGDSRLTDAREWTASTVSQAEAEAGTATTRRAWTAQRVFQAIAAWWAASAAKAKLDGIASGATVGATWGSNLASVPASIDAIDGLTPAADRIAYYTGGSTAALATLTSFARNLLDDTSASAMRTTLGLGTLATQSGTFSGTSSGTNTGDQTITLTGDVTGTGTGSFAATLSATGVTAGTYRSVTVDAKGRVTDGTNPTTLAGYGITDAAPLSHVGTGGTAHANAVASGAAGFMTGSDKAKLDGIASGAQVNTVTSVAGKTGAVTLVKGDVGLGNVDNTADAVKSVATAAAWTTARTITIGGTGKSVDGAAAVSWSLGEIGAAAASHDHPASDISDSTSAGRALLTAADAAAQRTALELGDAAQGTLMSSETDSTTGRVMRMNGARGAFGLGGTLAPLLANFDAASIPAGIYSFNTAGSTSGTGPGFTYGGVIVLQGIANGTEAPMMIAMERSSGTGKMAWRTSQAGTWGAWQTVAAIGHSHAISDVIGLQTALDAKQPAITTTEAVLTSDVSLTANNTWTDAVTLSLAAGTWLLTGQITMQRQVTNATTFMARISDGSNHYASGQQYQASQVNNNGTTISLHRVVTLASAATIRMQGLCTSGANSTDNRIIAQLSANASGDTATILTAMRIA